MESQRNGNTFIPVDPFKASIGFSIKNIWKARHEAVNDDANDIYLRPGAPPKTLAPFRFPGDHNSISNGLNPAFYVDSRNSRLSPHSSPSLASHHPTHPLTHFASATMYDRQDSVPALDQELGSDHHSCSRSHSLSISSPYAANYFDNGFMHSNSERASRGHTAPSTPVHVPVMPPSPISPLNSEKCSTVTYLLAFILDTVPRQVYLHLLLRLPYMYFSRVTRIFEEAEMSMPQIKQGILEMAMQTKEPLAQPWTLERTMENVPFQNLQNTWQAFIDSLLREWKTLNIISVLLLTAILTILQIDDASKDPLTRYAALISMICALMSLLYGCIYIIRFNTMRKSYKAAEWANEAQKTTQSIMWNIWVLLAMPAIWLAWSMALFIICIMSFVWRTGTVEDDTERLVTRDQILAARIIVTLVLTLGLVYLVPITTTLRRYGEMMDRAWHRRILGWVNDTFAEKLPLVSEKVTPQTVSATISPAAPSSTMDATIGPRVQGTNVVPASCPVPMTPQKCEHDVVQTVIPSEILKTITTADATMAKSTDSLQSSVLHREGQLQWQPKQPRDIGMLELYHIFTFPGERTDIKSRKLLRCNDKVWQSLKPEVRVAFEAALRLSWDPNSPECILPVLDEFNTTAADTIGGQLALCQKIQPDKSEYAIFFFSFMGPLPREQGRYESIPFDLDYLDIWLSSPNESSSSADPGMDTQILKVSLPSNCSTNSLTTSTVLPVNQPGIRWNYI